MVKGEDASSYFHSSGISELADSDGGLCAFWHGDSLAIYQNTNRPLADDVDLAPSINANAGLFGSFMGALAIDHEARPAKRAVVERILGNARFIATLDGTVATAARDFFDRHVGTSLALDDFALHLVAHVDSLLPGVLDFTIVPINAYLSSPTYGKIARNFFEIASEVISKVNPSANDDAELVVDMIRDILLQNFEAIAAAPATNMVRGMFAQWKRPFNRRTIEDLSSAELKEMGTVIIATYDTTALSLLWTIAFVETHPLQRQRLFAAIDDNDDALGVASLLVLEALRLGGSNPTALWRATIAPVRFEHRGAQVTLPVGTMLWLDRRRANRDAELYPQPYTFDIDNIRHIMKGDSEKTAPLLARNRFEINSFNMINTQRSPRKCPGRLFSVREQSVLILELYRLYDVTVSKIDTSLAAFSSMPRPRAPGVITIQPRA